MNTVERKQKLQTLPWYALHDIALQKKIDEKEINGKEKSRGYWEKAISPLSSRQGADHCFSANFYFGLSFSALSLRIVYVEIFSAIAGREVRREKLLTGNFALTALLVSRVTRQPPRIQFCIRSILEW